MDRSEFRAAEREVLDRPKAESNQPDYHAGPTPKEGHEPADLVREQGPSRPEGHPGARFARGQGDYVSETTAARKNNALINREYYEYARSAQEHDNTARTDFEKHIERTRAPEDLLQHFKLASREVTDHANDIPPRSPNDASERAPDMDPEGRPKGPAAAEQRGIQPTASEQLRAERIANLKDPKTLEEIGKIEEERTVRLIEVRQSQRENYDKHVEQAVGQKERSLNVSAPDMKPDSRPDKSAQDRAIAEARADVDRRYRLQDKVENQRFDHRVDKVLNAADRQQSHQQGHALHRNTPDHDHDR